MSPAAGLYRLLLRAILDRSSAENTIGADAKRLSTILGRGTSLEESTAFDAWMQGSTLLPDPAGSLVTPEDRKLTIGALLKSHLAGGPKSSESTSVDLAALLDELNSSSIVILHPDELYCMPPDAPLRAPSVAAVVGDHSSSVALARAISKLRPGFWPATAHLVDLAVHARERAPVDEALLLSE